MIVALAGRRIDAPGAETIRFPLNRIDAVKEKLMNLFILLKPQTLVCSGACGADLLALAVSGELKIRRSMVLPFSQSSFKTSSVTDRPGNWGDLYEKVCKEVMEEDKIVTLNYPEKDDETYRKTNTDILDRALVLAQKYNVPDGVVAIIVWEGKPKDENDTTKHFKKRGRKKKPGRERNKHNKYLEAMPTLQQHFDPTLPKRILALDGGGIRGALTLGYLQRIEDILRKQHDDNRDFRLCDYFDLIGGTSTGSIIASCLAIGMKVEDITKMYFNLGGKIFARRYRWWNIFEVGKWAKGAYDPGPLEERLQNVFGNITLGSDKILTGLCVVAKRADTNSVWPLINHPKGKYYEMNKDILLWKAVRASAAAPTYFIPEIIEVGGGLPTAAFVDGGVSMANNPSLQLLMVATLKGFPFHWKMGADNILLVSVGTGMSKWEKIPKDVSEQNLLNWASQIPDMLMQDASWHNQTILQWMSACNTRWCIDSEIGDLSDDLITVDTGNKGLLTYLRYNLWIDQATLKELAKKDYTPREIDGLVEMSNADSRFALNEMGKTAAENGAIIDNKIAATKVTESQFPESFKVSDKRQL